MLNPHTRASARALAAASARSDIRSRRPFLTMTAAIAACAGIALTAGFLSSPAAGAEPHSALVRSAPLVEVPSETQGLLQPARDAVTAAQTLNAEVAAAGLDLGVAPTAVDTAGLQASIDRLSGHAFLPALVIPRLADGLTDGTAEVVQRTTELRAALTAAQEKEAARVAAEQQAAAAAALASANTVEGAKATAQQLAAERYGWGEDQFSCLVSLWDKESGWNYQARNGSSGAAGIPQALPGSKMASAGADWQTSAATQIAWGLGYIADVYGTPCSAWGHSQATDWY